MFKKLHTAYINSVCNPFYDVGTNIKSKWAKEFHPWAISGLTIIIGLLNLKEIRGSSIIIDVQEHSVQCHWSYGSALDEH